MRSNIVLIAIILLFVLFAASCDFYIEIPGVDGETDMTPGNDGSKPETDDNDKSEIGDGSETESKPVCRHESVEKVEITAPSCTSHGLCNEVCRDCGEVVGFTETELVGHTEGAWKTDKEPTVEEKGIGYTFCTVCGARLEREIDAIGYSSGLVFKSTGEGVCAVIGRGDCTDTYVRIPPISPDGDRVNSIGANAFEEDEKLVSVYLPDTVTYIGNDAFSMSTVKEIRLSENIYAIGDNAFFGCELLESIDLPETLEKIGSNAFNSCRGLTGIKLPDGLKIIDGGAFSSCNNISEIHIPASVEYIGESVVSASKIKKITVDEDNKNYKIISNCLMDSDGLLIVGFGKCYIPLETVKIGRYAFMGNTGMSEAKIPSSVREIGDFAFCMTEIDEVIIPYGVRVIGNGAFDSCSKLSRVVIPNTVERIGYWVFEECNLLSAVEYYGSEENWNSIDVHGDNDCLKALSITYIEEISPDSVYGYGRTTISGNTAKLYDLFKVAMMGDILQSEINLDLADKITIDDFDLATQIFLSDHPECFWWRGSAGYLFNSEGYISKIEFAYDYSDDDIVAMKAELEAVVEGILAGLPDGSVFDKALYLHDAVAARVTYTSTENDQTPYGALVEGKAVCNGYATSYQMLLQRAGIRAWTVNGTSAGQNHAWNVVWISEGVCVYTDVTWDDQGVIMHYYFNMSLDEMKDDHSFSSDFILPECNHTEYSYVDVSAESIVIYDTDTAAKLGGHFVDTFDGGKMVGFYYMGNDFEGWLTNNAWKINMLAGGTPDSYTNLGNEYILFIK